MSKACTWGSDETASGDAYGNWAPVNMGVGTNADGATFISLLSTEQNFPNKIVPLNFNIELQGDFGGSACMYVVQGGQGQFCSGGTIDSPQNCKPHGQFKSGAGPVPGCTVGLLRFRPQSLASDADLFPAGASLLRASDVRPVRRVSRPPTDRALAPRLDCGRPWMTNLGRILRAQVSEGEHVIAGGFYGGRRGNLWAEMEGHGGPMLSCTVIAGTTAAAAAVFFFLFLLSAAAWWRRLSSST